MKIIFNGNGLELLDGSDGIALVKQLGLKGASEALALRVNGQPKDFSTPLSEGDKIEIFDFESPEGREVFWHTSAHVLAQAILRLYPQAKPTIGPPIEEGFFYDFYNLPISEHDFPAIEAEVKKVLAEKFTPKRSEYASKAVALEAFKENPFKSELIESFEEGSPLSAYTQGEFTDLCRGPHLISLSKIRAFKILKTSAAYWKGDASRESLTRVYGISFPSEEGIKSYLHRIEEAKKRDHRKLGVELDLYGFYEEAPGMPFFHPHGMRILTKLIDFWRNLHKKAGYVEIKTPTILTQALWERSGHWDHYRENMFTTTIEEKHYAIKPMNCPGCMLFFRSRLRSYREFPLRVAEVGHVHRYEFSGALSGLFRVRAFTQDDAHLFMRHDMIADEILSVLKLADTIYKTFGLTYEVALSTRPEKSKTIGSDQDWLLATEGLKDALKKSGHSYKINEGDGAFYGPKIDIRVFDALNRAWQCATIQLDMALPERFDLTYVDDDGKEKRPVMVHRALFGSIERFLGILVEHFAGKFPLWLSPYPIVVLNVADRHAERAKEVAEKLRMAGFEADLDLSGESVGKKIRNAQLLRTNYMITIGDREVELGTLAVRTREGKVVGSITVEAFLELISREVQTHALESLLNQMAEVAD